MKTLVWFRGKDLRLTDHAPLCDAVDQGDVIPLFVVDPYFFAPQRARELPHRMQFLAESLEALAANIAHKGSRLILVEGRSVDVVPHLARKWKVNRVVAHRWVEPLGRERDRRIREALKDIPFDLYEGETLIPPGTLRTGSGAPYSVFTPFSRAFLTALSLSPALSAPRHLPPVAADIVSTTSLPTCESMGIQRNEQLLRGGEKAARQRLKDFVHNAEEKYPTNRDRMDLPGTSRLSVDLKFGTLSVRQVWNDTQNPVFHNELLWREFSHSTLWDRPALLEEPFQEKFKGFPWRYDEALWSAWVEGKTGYPIVDASARQLLGEGFVHNRARMISASFLTKHLLMDYRRGEAHYLKYLTDGDWAQNNLGWQWSAGCGCDAQPYFRVFNPVTQGEKFDPDGDYVRRWVPELKDVPTKYVHRPWDAPRPVSGYPRPVVDHATARQRFLSVAAEVFSPSASPHAKRA